MGVQSNLAKLKRGAMYEAASRSSRFPLLDPRFSDLKAWLCESSGIENRVARLNVSEQITIAMSAKRPPFRPTLRFSENLISR
jgi:hypothetical protein